MPELERQKRLIHESNWDVLIILDACRYDYFEEIYDDYFEGNLKKVESEGTHTSEWLRNTFENGFDCVYVSGNPHINSHGSLSEGFESRRTFQTIVDAWDYGWSEKERTILPSKVGKVARMARAKFPQKKMMVHFMQPHYPYLSRPNTGNQLGNNVKKAKSECGNGSENGVYLSGLREFLGKKMERIFGRYLFVNFQRFVGIRKGVTERDREEKKFAEKVGREELLNAYEENLRLVLGEVNLIVDRLHDENVVVTADHGDLLGEDGLYGHFPYYNNRILKNVPWLEVEN